MKNLTGQELRHLWDKFWQSKQHTYLSEVSIIADKESTAMFNVAGMQQLIPYLMGKPHDLGKRVYNIQKCIRTVDIDEVGDASHLTFFTMMGNWSLGDYFKKEAVEWSWEFLTSEEYLGIDSKKLAVSVFKGDENAPQDNETASYWLNVGLGEDKISYLPAKNNRWSPGPVGPCGPDTEIFYRIGKEEYPPMESNVESDEDNWLEIWNDVFMEYYRDEQGILTKLKQQNVDTGMGFERICKVLQKKETIYESDLFQTIISFIEKRTSLKYENNKRRMRIIADHLRTALMVISDGCIASNVGAGYVLRMIIRRMYYNLILLNNQVADGYTSLFDEVFDFVSTQYKFNKKESILKSLEDELHQFKKTIANGSKLLQQMIDKNPTQLGGKDVFMLYDSYGFPIELTREIAQEKGIIIDEAGFEKAMEEAREKSRQSTKDMFKKGVDWSKYLEGVVPTVFVGYTGTEFEGGHIIKDFEVEGQRVLIFDQSPFYAESGGQTGDKGKLILDDGSEVEIIDVKKYEGVFLHFVR